MGNKKLTIHRYQRNLIEELKNELKLYKRALSIVNKQFGNGYKDEYYLDLARKEFENEQS